jgi:hypothetical protein
MTESGEIVIYPQANVGDLPVRRRTDDGCWRIPDDRIAVRSSISSYEVGAGQSVSEKFDIYTYGREIECLPAGRHVFKDQIRGSDESAMVDAVLTIDISKDGRVSVSEDETGINLS